MVHIALSANFSNLSGFISINFSFTEAKLRFPPENQKEITEFNTIKASSIIPDAFIVICRRTYQ